MWVSLIQHFFHFRYSILQLLQVFGPSIKLRAVFNNLMYERNTEHERAFQKRLWLSCCFKWSPNFPTSEQATAVNEEDSGALCQLGKPRASWFIHHLASTGPAMEEVIGSSIFLMPTTTMSTLLQQIAKKSLFDWSKHGTTKIKKKKGTKGTCFYILFELDLLGWHHLHRILLQD